MSKILASTITVAVVLILVVGMGAPVYAQTCGPLNNGRVADVIYKDNAIFFNPVIRYEYKRATLTISGPCEDIVRSFDPGEQIFFDLGEITRVLDGTYKWELRFEPAIDPDVREMLESSRGTGEEDQVWWSLWQKGSIPSGPSVDSQGFTVVNGAIIDPGTGEESQKSAVVAAKAGVASPLIATAAGFEGSSSAGSAAKGEAALAPKGTVLTNADGIIRNSLCVGFDCPNSPTFSDSTILLMENNTRIKFDDTSTINSFPRNDWEIEANSNLNGGASYLGFNDCGQSSQGGCASDLVFAVEAGARQNALYVESDGDVGFGTSNPVVRLHTIDGDTPALRLEQDGSSGFAPQTWDVAGNETSFFIRDATNGSTLPFRIFPSSDSNTLIIKDGNVGIGDTTPDAKLDVENGVLRVESSSSSGDPRIHVISNQAQTGAAGQPGFKFENTNTGQVWDFRIGGAGNLILNSNSGAVEFTFATNGDFSATGTKSFTVMDPGDSGQRIYYAALEGPEAGTYFRGTAKTVDGEAVIELPKFFSKVTEKEGLTVQLTPVGGWHQLYLVEKTPEHLIVRDAAGKGDVEFDFFVQGVRSGYSDFKVERPAVD